MKISGTGTGSRAGDGGVLAGTDVVDADEAGTGQAPPGLTVQRLAGSILAVASLIGTVTLGAWLHPDPYEGVAYWMGRAAVQSVYAALIALGLWSLLRHRWRIAYLLVFGILLTGVLSYHGSMAYQANSERIRANEVVIALRDGRRSADSLSEEERSNRYVDALLVMRDVYWELHARAESRMAHYRRLYDGYTQRGGFLDTGRLGSSYDLWYSYFQIHDLEHRLGQAEAARIRISDLLWTVNLLDVDGATRAAYAADLRTAAEVISEAQAIAIARERKTLGEMKQALDVLIDAEGHFRIVGAQIIFERPEDAARFAGKADTGNGR